MYVTTFLQKLKFYFIKIINDIRTNKFDFTNKEQNLHFALILILIGIIFFMSSLAKAEYHVDFTRVNGKQAIVIEYDNGLTKIYFPKPETLKTMDDEKILKEASCALKLKSCNDN